ncbi:uncharacterized protein THITE_2110588 [Thermothielavioides terrestris NRRL 8126]|uniref:Uncharacterized protein n=1 Tax=Thermothielavioides terrestris (strain ATCC 38088 / NRRL 8126) TaxID=578455 RepID=G2QTM3_THETT|nr:uncharacterized protein THITE_2110588 [Thermothielavioides terrestris NRRL 8126]AEO64442.1 hypothetical protein THITE_2110588 [Thermothielavioides terrestris NRRL 8126]
MALYVALAGLELGVILAAVPLWCVLPGAVFALWAAACAAVVAAMCWMLNGKEQMYRCDAGSEGWMMGQEVEDEKWMFLGGMGMSSRHCHERTLPALSRLFSRPMVCICMPTYGMPFDLIAMMLQRCMPIPSRSRRNLYSEMRCALLDDSMTRCVVLCHNDSAILVSQAVAQLHADVPMEKLGKLEIYTFGAAASEFTVPLGDGTKAMEPTQQQSAEQSADEQRTIHVEHFAMANDPFAQMGVLHSVRQNMEGRFCGSVFVLNDNSTPPAPPSKETSRRSSPRCSGLVMEDYLTALFPAQMMAPATRRSSSSGVLDSVMTVDKDCAEKREIAAMSNYHAATQAKKGGGGGGSGGSGKRLSWTGLAAMAGQRNGMNAGMVALEMARKECRSCDGRWGREVTWLARYVVAMEGKQAVDGRINNGL